MFIVTIDCGTTNTRLYVVNEKGDLISKVSRKIGVSNVAIHSNTDILKHTLKEMFNQVLLNADISEKKICCILASGVITSEVGLFELSHLLTPCTLTQIAENITNVGSLGIFPEMIPVYFIRGVKNRYDAGSVSINDIGMLDVMRGEETQIAGLLENKDFELPAIVIILSSHTKIIAVDNNYSILASVTSLSGQLYDVVSKGTVLKKSIKKSSSTKHTDYFNGEIIKAAYNEVKKAGFLRGLMCVRLLDILLHAKPYECRLFMESLFAADDEYSIRRLCSNLQLNINNFVLIGNSYRCSVYKYILQEKIGNECNISMITNKLHIDKLSISGALSIAKKANIL
jgi:2-dehydro-3-deoxygalactonokinase